MAPKSASSRVLRFAVGGALLSAPLGAGGCDKKGEDPPNVNEGPVDPPQAEAGEEPEEEPKPEEHSETGEPAGTSGDDAADAGKDPRMEPPRTNMRGTPPTEEIEKKPEPAPLGKLDNGAGDIGKDLDARTNIGRNDTDIKP